MKEIKVKHLCSSAKMVAGFLLMLLLFVLLNY